MTAQILASNKMRGKVLRANFKLKSRGSYERDKWLIIALEKVRNIN